MKENNFRKLISFISLFFFLSSIQAQHEGHDHHDHEGHSHKGLPQFEFIENKNQFHENVKFEMPMGGMNRLFLEEKAFTYLFYEEEIIKALHDLGLKGTKEEKENYQISGHSYKVKFQNALSPTITGNSKKKHYYNYFKGDDPSKWAGGIPVFEKVYYENLYNNINLETYSEEGHFKYDFIVEPNGNPDEIKLEYEGMDRLALLDGNLIIYTSVGNARESKPYAYQVIQGKEIKVECNYVLENNVLSFHFPNGYEETSQLVIDPQVVGATLSGTTGSANFGHTATFDNEGNIYAGGISFGSGYPTNNGAFQQSFGGGEVDMAVTKYNPTGSTLLYATYIGGTGSDFPHSMIVDFNNQLSVLGSTYSGNFPTTSNAFQNNLGGNSDIVITKLNANGTGLVGSTYIGGSGSDGINQSNINISYGEEYRGEIVLDGQGNIYVASVSSSSNFPTTANAFQENYTSAQEAVVFKMNSDLSTLYWSTYLGSTDNDTASGLRVDDFGNTFVAGTAGAADFPMVATGVQNTWLGGQENAYLVSLSANGQEMTNGTFWGTSNGNDHGYFVDIDEDNNIHMIGTTTGTGILHTPNAYSNNPDSKQFLVAFNSQLSQVVYSTTIGRGNAPIPNGSFYDFVPIAFMVDKCNNIYFSGYLASSGLPTTSDAINVSANTFYLGVLTPNAEDLSFGTYYANADHVDGGTSRFDKAGIVYQAVCSCFSGVVNNNSVLNTNSDAWATGQSEYCDIGVFKIDFEIETVTAAFTALPSASGCVPFNVDFDYTGQDGETFTWIIEGNEVAITENTNYTFNEVGTYTVMLIAEAGSTCNVIDTSFLQIDVLDGTSNLTEHSFCPGEETLFLDVSTVNATYNWQDNSTGATYQVTEAGTYWVDITIPGCSQRDSFIVEVASEINVLLGADQSFCDVPGLDLSAFHPQAAIYEWSTGEDTPTITVSTTDNYAVTLYDEFGCTVEDEISLVFGTTPVFSLEDSLICEGEVITLTTPLDVEYLWSDGSTASTLDISQPGIYGLILNDNGCYFSDSMQLSFAPEMAVNLGEDQSVCDVTSYTLNAFHPNAALYEWSTGEETPSVVVSESNNYAVTLYDEYGCSVEDDINLVFSTTPVFSLEDSLICEGEVITLTTPLDVEYLWSNGSTDDSINISEAGEYSLELNNNGCYYSDAMELSVSHNPVALFAHGVSCEGDCDGAIDGYLINSNLDILELEWSTGSTDLSLEGLCPGIYTLTVTNEVGCVFVNPAEVLEPSIVEYELTWEDVTCPGDANGIIEVINTSGGTPPYQYSWNGEPFIYNSQLDSLSGGDNNVIITDANGCSFSEDIFIYEPFENMVDAGEDKRIELGDSVRIDGYVLSTTGQDIFWTENDGIWCTRCIKPFASPVNTTTYVITVIDIASGCIIQDSMTVFVDKPRAVYIPNAFTPNLDGFNDNFTIYTNQGVRRIKSLKIFDRWGELVFQDENFPPNDDTQYGWNGMFREKEMNPAVFAYVAEVEFKDDAVILFKGDVTLVR